VTAIEQLSYNLFGARSALSKLLKAADIATVRRVLKSVSIKILLPYEGASRSDVAAVRTQTQARSGIIYTHNIHADSLALIHQNKTKEIRLVVQRPAFSASLSPRPAGFSVFVAVICETQNNLLLSNTVQMK